MMKQIDNLYKKLISCTESSGQTVEINEQIRDKLHKMILDDLKKLRKKQHKTVYISEEYKKLDHEIRLRLLKEIQVILNEYVLARENGDLKNWKAMYGEIGHYIKNFFYYRMDEKYEAEKKALKDYKFLDEV
ncbi:MAG: hypothetical protein KAJ00_10870 [Deltaproteobacteria bacterium]|jgi:hypothetical protein|nr:hypothetical protein [Deltaproteobacteria bacterium]